MSFRQRRESIGYWRYATDTKSGRIYYYNTKTKETTWNKPFELCSPMEQSELIKKRNEAIKFFREMEDNIKRNFKTYDSNIECKCDDDSMSMIHIRSSSMDSQTSNYSNTPGKIALTRMISPIDPNSLANSYGSSCYGYLDNSSKDSNDVTRSRINSMSTGNRIIRTISTIDEDIVDIYNEEASKARSAMGPPDNISSQDPYRRHSSYIVTDMSIPQIPENRGPYFSSQTLKTSHEDPLVLQSISMPKVSLKRRNSTGTIYVATTMSSQDNEATIKCVCLVIRAHIMEANKKNLVPTREYDVFKDLISTNVNRIPTLNEIKEFFMQIFSKSQLESECIIMALIYCERMVKETNGKLCIRHDNWKSIDSMTKNTTADFNLYDQILNYLTNEVPIIYQYISIFISSRLFACLVMSSKVWDDLSMWNVDFSQVCPSFSLQRVNALELAILEALDYVIRVPASEYAKYYFHLRSMMARLGFHENEPKFISPLDINGARKLQLATERYQEDRQTIRFTQSVRINHSNVSKILRLDRIGSVDGFESNRSHGITVGLEHLVHSEHNDGDGGIHKMSRITKSNRSKGLSKSTTAIESKRHSKYGRAFDSLLSSELIA